MKAAEKVWKPNDCENSDATEKDRLVERRIWTRGEDDGFGFKHIELGC